MMPAALQRLIENRLVNDSGDIAISLHVYGVGQDRVSTGINRILG